MKVKLLIFFFIAFVAVSQLSCTDELYKEYIISYNKT